MNMDTIDDDVKNILMSYIQICDKHSNKLQAALAKTQHLLPFTIYNVENLNELDNAFIEVVIGRFAKLQDTCGQKIFSLVLICQGEDVRDKTFIDILNLFEKFGFIDDSNFWLKLRKTRNTLAHEYPNNQEKLITALNAVYSQSKELIGYWQFLKRKINKSVFVRD